jgi:hypothetical protein
MHAPFLHSRLLPHDWPFFDASGVVAHLCSALQVGRLHGVAGQSVPAFEHENLHVVSHPVPGPFANPLSQS